MFYSKIENSTAHRPIRDILCLEALSNNENFSVLVITALNTNDSNHYKACWILELVLEKNLDLLLPYLDSFCSNAGLYKHQGAIRSVSKIALFIANRHHKTLKTGGIISPEQINMLIDSCFDWLIGDAKVASKAYAMRALLLLGKYAEWVYPELKQILTEDYIKYSSAYQAAARDVLKKLNRKGLSS